MVKLNKIYTKTGDDGTTGLGNGGSPASAALHLARTVARRAERLMVELADLPGEQVNPAGLHYINRVSDLLFVAARSANDNGKTDVLWIPGENR